jgi:hypothetical protein
MAGHLPDAFPQPFYLKVMGFLGKVAMGLDFGHPGRIRRVFEIGGGWWYLVCSQNVVV